MKVLVCDPVVARFMDVLRGGCPDAEWTYRPAGEERAVLEALADADVFVGARLTPAMLDAAPRLRFVQVSGAGTDRIAHAALAGERGITVSNVFGHEVSIAEHVLMVVLALGRDLLTTDRALRGGYWRNAAMHPQLPLHRTLQGRTLGLVGYGHIGRQVEKVVSALGMSVIAIRGTADAPAQGPVLGGPERLAELLSRSDVVVVVAPLTEATRGMIGAAELALMRADAYLVNVARGPMVDEDALYEALAARRIAGAALDVWYQPGRRFPETGLPGNRPFHDLENVVLTPHVSGVTDHTFRTRAEAIAENVRRLIQGLVPHDVVSAGGTSVT